MMNLAEYRHSNIRLADFLPWAALVDEGIVLNKDGSFQRTAKFRGPDLDSVVPAERVQIKVQDGWVTLKGEVDWQFQRLAAENSIRRLSGVSGVVNNIALQARVQLSDVRNRIEEALRRSAEVEAQAIQISSLGYGRVALEGKVHDWQEREAVRRAAWSVAGVRSVEDRLRIA